jgi:hypothetical protein
MTHTICEISKFNIHMHFILSFKYNIFNVWRWSVWLKHVACIDMIDKMCRGWQQFVYQFLRWEALRSRSEANATLDWSAVPYQMCGLFNVTASGKNHRNYKRQKLPKTYAEWANCKSKFNYHLRAQLMTSTVQGAMWLTDVRVVIKITYVQYLCYYFLCCRIKWYTCILYMRMRFRSQLWKFRLWSSGVWHCNFTGVQHVCIYMMS